MYIPPPFRIDEAASLAFAATRGFGLVTACADGRITASPLPFYIEQAAGGCWLAFHVARGNRLADIAASSGRWLVAVWGSDAYVSPHWYKSPDQVPTWLYESVQLAGPVRVMSEGEQREHLDRLTAAFETRQAPAPPWTVDLVTPARREALMRAIVAIEMTIESVEGSFKLNQHKSDADHVAVAAALAGQDDAGARAIAAHMMVLRPHLEYGANETERAGEQTLAPAK
ncbi:MAG: FMN-binding negative transcriptional regulator [Hyphomicrobiales bacterium]|nr:FMN-binding negative transcriptional regulator [Hyphomicrobiales bacterium]MBV8823366.1 FMN-binding negative transcriptional regulator [Hyphomicrobiales bacterium]MBV9429562.1 FMN-binding negative transcriptional regulator [Bradyrhizobiaceae bacterium]